MSKQSYFAKYFKPYYCQYLDENSNLSLRNYVYNKWDCEKEKENTHIVFYNCLPQKVYDVLKENIPFLNEYNYAAIEIFGALPYCPENWSVCSTHSIYGQINISITIEYKSSSDISHCSQLYLFSINTITDNKMCFHQIIQRIEMQNRHKNLKKRLDETTDSHFEIVELYENNNVLCLEEEIFCKPRFGDSKIEISGLCCPDFYLEPLL